MIRGLLKFGFHWKTCSFVIGLFASFIIYQSLSTSPSNETTKTQAQALHRRKVILYWQRTFDKEHNGMGLGQEAYEKAKCPISNCEGTTDRRRIAEADAIVFHCRWIYIERGKLPGSYRNSIVPGYDLPTYRLPHQRWIFYFQESPIHTYLNLKHFTYFFNWTMTYRKDSDIEVPHGFYHQKHYSLGDGETKDYIKTKKKLVVWFVSHCKTQCKRMEYVNKLRQYIQVDIYGECGTLKCPREYWFSSKKCYDLISRDYYFYLSFENSICRDYHSPKFWSILQNTTTVPIVRGGGDYQVDAPPHSYIDANNLTPKELAEKLTHLAADRDAYNEYHAWRDRYEVIGNQTLNARQAFCRLCQALHNDSLPVKTYPDITKFWSKENDCLNLIDPQLE